MNSLYEQVQMTPFNSRFFNIANESPIEFIGEDIKVRDLKQVAAHRFKLDKSNLMNLEMEF